MKNSRELIAVFLAAALAFAAVPVANALPARAEEYLLRLATGTLYIPYTALGADKPQEDAVSTAPNDKSENESTPAADTPDPIPQDAIAVQAVNLSRLEPTDTPTLLLSNETAYSADLAALAKKELAIPKGSVLIVHTHGTESYLPDGAEYYTEDEDFRSTDTSENVVAVGEAFAEVLRAEGIQVYHDTVMYDESSFNNAYTASRTACKKWLEQHPDIGYIIDIHRDAVTDAEGKVKKTLCTVNGTKSAQVMLVIGTDEAGANHSGWENNLALAAKYQELLNRYPTLARPIYLRRASYNQQLCAGSMLLEIGSGANTLAEAKTAARLAAKSFVLLYRS